VETLAQLAAVAALNRTSLNQAALFATTRLCGTHGRLFGTAELSAAQSRDLLERALHRESGVSKCRAE
jgi:putative acyl-CoA dehydrogenase